MNLRAAAVERIFGSGLQAEIAERGLHWLSDEGRRALHPEPERLTTVRLRPGETYTVIARPRPTRGERRLARRATALAEADRRMSRPTRRQLTAARRLARSQARLDRRRPGTRRWNRAAAREAARAAKFDRAIAPGRRLARTRAHLAEVESQLEASREASFERARAAARRPTSRERRRVFD